MQGLWSIRIHDPFRIVFRFEHGNAPDVQITDDHEELAMTPKHRPPTPPGELLLEEFLKPLGFPQVALAAKMGVSIQHIHTLINGKRGVTAETALRLAAALDTTPELWMNLQTAHDLWHARRALRSAG